ncbi:MAG TPA: ATP-binding protein [Candidatus Competibacteraceae bacterium]|nr:ATP-binding protein [Candidatus Competibacteraceae bacterium]
MAPDQPVSDESQCNPNTVSAPADADSTRLRALAQRALRDGALRWAEEALTQGDHDLSQLIEDLRVYQAELEIQNEELQQSQNGREQALARFSTLFSALPVAALVVDRYGRILNANNAATQRFALDIPGQRRRLFGHLVVETDRSMIRATFSEARTNPWGSIQRRAIGFLSENGSVFSGDLYIAALNTEQNKDDDQFICVILDQTETLRAKQALSYASFQAGLAEMSTTLLHNIGNAINVVIEDSYQLRRGCGQLEQVAAALEAAAAHAAPPAQAVQREAARVLRRLLDQTFQPRTARMERGVAHIAEIIRIQQDAARPDRQLSRFRIEEVIREVLALQEDSLGQQGISPQVQVAAGLDEVCLPRNQLLQALMNLIRNAYDALRECDPARADPGTLRISAQPDRPGFFRLSVADNGIGIAPEQQAQLFHFGYTTKPRGNGYGLHSVANFAQSLGGQIAFESPGPGQGATFSLVLPLHANREITQ